MSLLEEINELILSCMNHMVDAKTSEEEILWNNQLRIYLELKDKLTKEAL